LIAEWEQFNKEGLIRAIGFSYHGDEKTFLDIIGHYDWDMAQIQQNFLDTEAQATERGIKACGKKGIACVIMEPLRGGGLASPPAAVQALYDAHPVKHSGAEWAFRHLLDYPEVSCVLSGLSTLAQVEDSVRIFSEKDAVPGCLSADDKALLARAREKYNALRPIPCTACKYCMPCPNGVNIPNAFTLYNDGFSFTEWSQSKRAYSFATKGKSDASLCAECGLCETKCPQKIAVMKELKVAHEKLKGWVE
jgi:predicted aldo/keto reductase-like oxidoreductase